MSAIKPAAPEPEEKEEVKRELFAPEPEEKMKVKRINLTGVPDDELFAPDWLRGVTETFVEKKIYPTYSNRKITPQIQKIFAGYCPWCGLGLYGDDECVNCNSDSQYHSNSHQQVTESINNFGTEATKKDAEIEILKEELKETVKALEAEKQSSAETYDELKETQNKLDYISGDVSMMMNRFDSLRNELITSTTPPGWILRSLGSSKNSWKATTLWKKK